MLSLCQRKKERKDEKNQNRNEEMRDGTGKKNER
jgi:hypothetical protein